MGGCSLAPICRVARPLLGGMAEHSEQEHRQAKQRRQECSSMDGQSEPPLEPSAPLVAPARAGLTRWALASPAVVTPGDPRP